MTDDQIYTETREQVLLVFYDMMQEAGDNNENVMAVLCAALTASLEMTYSTITSKSRADMMLSMCKDVALQRNTSVQ